MARIVPAPEGHRSVLTKKQWFLSSAGRADSDEELGIQGRNGYPAGAGPEGRAPLASDPSAEAGGIRRGGLGIVPGLPLSPSVPTMR